MTEMLSDMLKPGVGQLAWSKFGPRDDTSVHSPKADFAVCGPFGSVQKTCLGRRREGCWCVSHAWADKETWPREKPPCRLLHRAPCGLDLEA
jgi:hypothetical protein